jgi:hypothetical protein
VFVRNAMQNKTQGMRDESMMTDNQGRIDNDKRK